MAKKIELCNFSKFLIDMDDNNNIYIVTNEEKKIKIGKHVSLKIKEDDIEINVKSSKEFMSNSLRTYTKDILFVESDPLIKNALKDFFSNPDNENKEVFVVNGISTVYIGESINDINLSLKALEESKQAKISKTDQKEKLKAYETPTNTYDIIFSLMQKNQLPAILKQEAKDLLPELRRDLNREIANKKDKKETPRYEEEILSILKNKDSILLITNCLIASYNNTRRTNIEASIDSHQKKILSYLDENFPKLMQDYKEIGEATFPFTKLSEDRQNKLPAIPVLDLQAGSGKGILTSATNTSQKIVLQGMELRSKENLGITEDLDERYEVLDSKNFLVYAGDVKDTFSNGILHKAVVNTPTYLNPPYNANNQIAKLSVDVLKHNQQFYGLFPTSMKAYLTERVKGHIFEVPRSVTGYTDPKTPEYFLLVVGAKFDEEFVEEQLASIKGDILNSKQFKKSTFFKNLSAKNLEEAIKEISFELNKNKNDFDFEAVINSTFDYFNKDGKTRSKMITNSLIARFEKTDEFLQNSEKIKELFETKKDEIQKEFGSEKMLLREKIFPDVRYFNNSGKIERISFNDVVNNQGLLVAYRDNYPEILKLVEKIASQVNVELDILKSNTSLYNLDNPFIPKQKDKKTTEHIGLMKNYYLPSSFDLRTQKNKNHLLAIIEDVYKQKGMTFSSDTKDTLKIILSKSTRLITKLEQRIKEETKVLNEEVFVLNDEDNNDIAKLNISKTDLYTSLEQLGYFNIDNYTELAVLSDDKKAVVMEKFLEHMENFIYVLQENSKTNIKPQLFPLLKKVSGIKKEMNEGKITSEKANDEIHKVYVNFMKDNKIDNFFENKITFNPKLKSDFEKELKQNIIFSRENQTIKQDDFIETIFQWYKSSPLDFFEFKRVKTEDKLDDYLLKNIPDLTEREIKDFKISIFNALSEDFVNRKAVFEAGVRSAKLLVSNYSYAKYKEILSKKQNKPFDLTSLYNELYKNITINTFGFMEHQHTSPERFLEVSDEKKLEMMMWEMRAGKTLGFSHMLYLLSLHKQQDGYMFLNSGNINDISLQLLSHMPHLFAFSNFYIAQSNLSDSVINSSNSYTHLSIAEYYPNMPTILSKYFVGRGDLKKSEQKNYAKQFEELMELVDEQGLTIEEMKEKYSDSKFLKVLDISCMKNS